MVANCEVYVCNLDYYSYFSVSKSCKNKICIFTVYLLQDSVWTISPEEKLLLDNCPKDNNPLTISPWKLPFRLFVAYKITPRTNGPKVNSRPGKLS